MSAVALADLLSLVVVLPGLCGGPASFFDGGHSLEQQRDAGLGCWPFCGSDPPEFIAVSLQGSRVACHVLESQDLFSSVFLARVASRGIASGPDFRNAGRHSSLLLAFFLFPDWSRS